MAGRPRKSTIVVKEIEEGPSAIDEKAKEITVEEPKMEVVEKDAPVDIPEKKETTFDEYKEEILKDPEFKEVYEKTPIRRGIVKCDTPTSWLNVRNAPNGEIIGKLDHGSAVDIFEIQKDFGKISATEQKWVSLNFIV